VSAQSGAMLCQSKAVATKRRNSSEIFRYLWQCFCPEMPRDSCSTRYDFGLWGESDEPLVSYFKDRGSKGPGKLNNLYQYLVI